MRTNVVLNEELLAEAMRYSQARSKSALLEEALRVFVETRASEDRRKRYERRLLDVQRRLADVRLRESSADIIRSDRTRP